MSAELTTTERHDLETLAGEIRREVEQAEQHWHSALQHAIRAGELLIEAKVRVKHGEWLPWLKANCPLGEREAQNYMRLARNSQRIADLPSVRQAVALLAEPRNDVQHSDAVREIVGPNVWAILTNNQRGRLGHLWAVARADVERLVDCMEGMSHYVRCEERVIYADARLEILAWALIYWAEHPDAPRIEAQRARRRGHKILADIEWGDRDPHAA